MNLLQSEGELTIASTGKDDQGRMKTEEYHVEGPVMIFLTTTAVDIDEELLQHFEELEAGESMLHAELRQRCFQRNLAEQHEHIAQRHLNIKELPTLDEIENI